MLYTVTKIIGEYLENATLADVTRKQSGYHLKKFIEYFGRKRAANISGADLAEFVERERRHGLAMTSIATRVRIFRAVIHWALRTGRINVCCVDNYRLPKIKVRRVAPPDESELRKMLNVCSPHIEKAIRIGWQLGCRIGPSELFSLRWDDVDLQARIIRMPNAKKGAESDCRVLPIPDALLARMKEWQKDSEFVISWHGKKVGSIKKAFDAARKRAGISRKFTPYSLRHAFATQALGNGAPIKGVCAVMGHSSPRMVLEVYQHINFETMKKTIEKVEAI